MHTHTTMQHKGGEKRSCDGVRGERGRERLDARGEEERKWTDEAERPHEQARAVSGEGRDASSSSAHEGPKAAEGRKSQRA